MRRLAAVIVLSAFLHAPPSARAAGPDFDITAGARPGAAATARLENVRRDPALSMVGTPAHYDERYGVPSFLWATRTPRAGGAATSAALRPAPATAARNHLGRLAPWYGLDPADIESATLRYVHDTGEGGIIVAFTQVLDGVEVFRDELKILMGRDRELLAASGYLPGRSLMRGGGALAFRLAENEAVRLALDDFGGAPANAGGITPLGAAEGGYLRFDVAAAVTAFPAGLVPGQPARVKRVWFHLPESLEPAYYVELMSADAAQAYAFSATDGRLLFRHDQMASDVFTYRVWADGSSAHVPMDGPQGTDPSPHPTGTVDNYAPAYIPPVLIALQNGPISTNDPWLAPGATETNGNNVNAYADLFSPDGFTAGDFRATTTSANTFDRTYDPALAPNSSAAQQMAAITQLFFDNNFFHDWYYDAGFDEPSGNAQVSNFGRGGVQADPVRAEAQDYGGLNNANMSTPSDGGSPRMQMYVWTASKLTVTAPAGIAGDYQTGNASFGPQLFSVTADVVLVNDGVGTTSDGCEAYGGLAGKIALIDRGPTCGFTVKVKNAQNAGAIGAIIADDVVASVPPGLGGTDGTITIPSLGVTQAVGNSIKTALGGGAVTVTLTRARLNDGTIDNQIVAHEWGHYISNRLVGNSAGLTTNMARGMGEGWADFHSLLITVRAEDATAPGGPNFSGVYGVAPYALTPYFPSSRYYFGIRRVPYSTDFTKNALTFKHIQAGVPLPPVPTAFGADGSGNAAVHRTGEIWCTMLWECYASLLRDTGRLTFAQAQDRMKRYLVAGYKLTPNAPTLVEARDAVLAAALANDPADFQLFWQAFATRGAGVGAVAPDRYAADNIPVTESFSVGGDLALISATLSDDIHACDTDTYIDNGERGQLTVTVKNVGSTTLSGSTVTLSSTNPNVTFPSGNSRPLSSMAPFGTATAAVPVQVDGAVGVQILDLQVSYDDPGLFVPGPRIAAFDDYGNADEVPSANESVEAHAPPWTYSGTPASSGQWSRIRIGATDHRFHAFGIGTAGDHVLVSPPLQVAGSGSFSFSFDHMFSFEKDAVPNYFDGGVIEITTNGGGIWTDIGASASPGYGGTIFSGSGNPLSGRLAYVGASPGYPALSAVTVNLGTTYQSQTVQVRFRLGTDAAVADHGWEISSLSFANLTNQPFKALSAELSPCTPLAVGDALPRELSLASAGPNPGPASLRFALPVAGRVELAIFDLAGRRVATLADGEYPAGAHVLNWRAEHGRGGNGIYFARLLAGGRELRHRLVVIQ